MFMTRKVLAASTVLGEEQYPADTSSKSGKYLKVGDIYYGETQIERIRIDPPATWTVEFFHWFRGYRGSTNLTAVSLFFLRLKIWISIARSKIGVSPNPNVKCALMPMKTASNRALIAARFILSYLRSAIGEIGDGARGKLIIRILHFSFLLFLESRIEKVKFHFNLVYK